MSKEFERLRALLYWSEPADWELQVDRGEAAKLAATKSPPHPNTATYIRSPILVKGRQRARGVPQILGEDVSIFESKWRRHCNSLRQSTADFQREYVNRLILISLCRAGGNSE
jgi:hypothetical protein